VKTVLPLPDSLRTILDAFPRALIVGGSVRDHFLGLIPKDFDVEVYGQTSEQMQAALASFGRVELVGESFGVLKVTTPDGATYDFSAPRRDSRVPGGQGHKAFKVEFDPTITEIEAASRRDLTINALAWNPKTGDVLDFFGGLSDLEAKVLRHTSIHFQDDPLRPLRIFQFAARMDFTVAPETAILCRTMAHQCASLPKERIGEEFNKFLLKGKNHLAGFRALSQMGWLAQFPELHALENFPQDVEFHPEGDVLTHTGLCLTALSRQPRWQALPDADKMATMYGMLCHDLAKAVTTRLERKARLNRDAIISPGHDKAGVPIAMRFMERLNVPKVIQERAASLVSFHMEHLQVKGDAQIRRLAVQLERENIERLGMIVEGDMSGRPPLPQRQAEDMQKIIDRAEVLGCRHAAPVPVLQGRDILQWGIRPGKAVGVLLDSAYQAQIKGQITDMDSAREWFNRHRGVVLENAKLAPPRLLSGQDLMAAAIPAGPVLGRLHRDLFDRQLDGKISTRQDAVSFLKENAADYALDPATLSRLETICATPAKITATAQGK
jgi:tRNA nucleotidyltransferase (CCA-adding enzyme)